MTRDEIALLLTQAQHQLETADVDESPQEPWTHGKLLASMAASLLVLAHQAAGSK